MAKRKELQIQKTNKQITVKPASQLTYSRAQVTRIVDADRKRHYEFYRACLADFASAFEILNDLLLFANNIDWLSAHYRGDELLEKLPEVAAGDFSKLLTQFLFAADRLDALDNIKPVREFVQQYVEAIRTLHNEGDNGQALRELKNNELAMAVGKWRDARKRPGPTTGQYWRESLRHRWYAVQTEHPKLTPGEIRQYILEEIAQIAPQGKGDPMHMPEYTLKLGTGEIERKWLNSLTTDTAINRTTQYRNDLLRDSAYELSE